MKNKLLRVAGSIIVILIAVFSYVFIYEPRYKGLLANEERILVFAHRGFGNHAPDNSLAGAELALKNKLDGVDVDGQFSADKQTIIFHDVSLERFTSGTGRVDSKTAQELKTYDLSIKFEKEFPSTYIATFEEFVKTITPQAHLMVELKVPGTSDTGIEKQVNEIIAKYNAYDRVFISSFNPVVLYRLKQIEPRIRTVFIFMDTGWDPKRVAETKPEDRVTLPWYLRTEITRVAIRKIIKPDALSINYGVREKVIDKLIARGYPVFLWSPSEESAIQWALNKQPYGIISDEPLQAKQLRDNFSN